MSGESRKLRLASDVIYESIEDEILALDLRNDQYFAFEGIGSRVFQLLVEGGETSAVVARLKQEFDVSEAVLNEDVRAFVEELLLHGLVFIDEES